MLSRDDQAVLFVTARRSIEHGLIKQKALLPDTSNLEDPLITNYATFVTLKLEYKLRGCIGTNRAVEPLIISVANNAFAAAFRDPRFKPLTATEYPQIQLSLSLLTEPVLINFVSEAELLKMLQPGVDGLIIERQGCKATFLPVVWESLTTATDFLSQLKLKAGIASDQTIEKAWRYRAESYEE